MAYTIQYKSIQQAFTKIDQIGVSGFDDLVVYNVTPAIFHEINHERESRGRKFIMNLYSPEESLLIITVPNETHEQLAIELNMEIVFRIREMGIRYSWRSVGRAQYSPPLHIDEHKLGIGEGDGGGKPRKYRPGPEPFITLVIEVGYSQSLQSLHQKMKRWFQASNHDIKIVLLTYTDYDTTIDGIASYHRLTVEKWIEVLQYSETGAMATHAATLHQTSKPICQQTTVIRHLRRERKSPRQENNQWDLFDINNSDMLLEFHVLFLEEPAPDQNNIVLNRGVWRYRLPLVEHLMHQALLKLLYTY